MDQGVEEQGQDVIDQSKESDLEDEQDGDASHEGAQERVQEDSARDYAQDSQAAEEEENNRFAGAGWDQGGSEGIAQGPEAAEMRDQGSTEDLPQEALAQGDLDRNGAPEALGRHLEKGNGDKPERQEVNSSSDASASGEAVPKEEPKTRDTIRKLGNILEEWHQANRKIRDQAQDPAEKRTHAEKQNMDNADFEHLPNDDAEADTQALGAAVQEEAQPMDMSADSINKQSEQRDYDALPDADSAKEEDEDEDASQPVDDPMQIDNEDPSSSTNDRKHTMIGTKAEMADQQVPASNDNEEDIDHASQSLSSTHLSPQFQSSQPFATTSWMHHTAHTLPLAQSLTESLRMILTPTTATKLRGDFRTGKRLNIKRIIPYIASSYKRDRIWMRRSIPSKRAYQIMLAIDDSKSMTEKGSADLAFSTLALVAQALNLLEAGELGVVGFGDDIFVAHELGAPFEAAAGEEVVRRFRFQQQRTNVRELVAKSLEIFDEARMKAHGSSADLWQLQFIISDGICEDHDGIHRLLLDAHEMRVMIVFIIVDAAGGGGGNTTASTGAEAKKHKNEQSITDLEKVEFVDQAPAEDGQSAPPKLVRRKYLDSFPFKYYLIVRDVRDLPEVLAEALRMWFAEVAGS